MRTSENSFAKRLRESRGELGLTQGSLAERVGVHLVTLSRWESGISPESVDVIEKLSDALNVRFEWLAIGRGRKR